jgi:hypothetical protein
MNETAIRYALPLGPISLVKVVLPVDKIFTDEYHKHKQPQQKHLPNFHSIEFKSVL